MAKRDQQKQRLTIETVSRVGRELHAEYPKLSRARLGQLVIGKLMETTAEGHLLHPGIYQPSLNMVLEVMAGRAPVPNAGGGVYKRVDWLQPVFPPAEVHGAAAARKAAANGSAQPPLPVIDLGPVLAKHEELMHYLRNEQVPLLMNLVRELRGVREVQQAQELNLQDMKNRIGYRR